MSENRAASEHTQEETTALKETILIVEDDKNFRDSLSLGVEMKGYQVFAADNGVAARELFSRLRIDLVITDMRMPDMNGVELLEGIRAEEARRVDKTKTPVVLITGFADYDAVVRALRLGATDYLSKPFTLDEFFNIISMHLGLKKLQKDEDSRHIKLEDVVKQRTRDLLDTNYKLRQLTEEKNQYISLVSNELKNPLNSLLGSIQRALDPQTHLDPVKMTDCLREMRDEGEGMLRLINDLLKVQQTESAAVSLQLVKADIRQVVEKIAAKFRASHPQVPIKLSLPSHTIIVEMDASKIEEALVHIVENALKYSPQETGAEITVTERDRNIEVRVDDHGQGIPSENIDDIFNAFIRGSNALQGKKGGFGLGLLICRSIIHAHQGTVRVESELNKGSTFFVLLPKGQAQLLI